MMPDLGVEPGTAFQDADGESRFATDLAREEHSTLAEGTLYATAIEIPKFDEGQYLTMPQETDPPIICPMCKTQKPLVDFVDTDAGAYYRQITSEAESELQKRILEEEARLEALRGDVAAAHTQMGEIMRDMNSAVNQYPGHGVKVRFCCRQARKGDCWYGDQCRYLHESASRIRTLEQRGNGSYECERIIERGGCYHVLRNRNLRDLPRNTHS